MKIVLISVALALAIGTAGLAGEPCKTPAACTEVQTCGGPNQCGRCGHAGACEKYCKVVCEMKEVKKTVWVVHCEDFCAPLPNCPHKSCGCGNCQACTAAEPACGGCEGKKCDPCAVEKNKHVVPPKCGKVREKKTLEKKEIVCKVPSYKCVVVYACSDCGCQDCGDGKAAPMPSNSVKPATPPAAPAPAPAKTTLDAPMPALIGASFAK